MPKSKRYELQHRARTPRVLPSRWPEANHSSVSLGGISWTTSSAALKRPGPSKKHRPTQTETATCKLPRMLRSNPMPHRRGEHRVDWSPFGSAVFGTMRPPTRCPPTLAGAATPIAEPWRVLRRLPVPRQRRNPDRGFLREPGAAGELPAAHASQRKRRNSPAITARSVDFSSREVPRQHVASRRGLPRMPAVKSRRRPQATPTSPSSRALGPGWCADRLPLSRSGP